LTKIVSTGMPIKNVEFPTITFCSPGTNEIRTQTHLMNLFYEYLQDKHGMKIDLAPLAMANILNKVVLISNLFLLFYVIRVFLHFFTVNFIN
jgi:hypothetical protein